MVVVLAGLLIGGGTAYYMYNKPPQDIQTILAEGDEWRIQKFTMICSTLNVLQ